MNEEKYLTLKAGDKRREGDEVRHVDLSIGHIHCGGLGSYSMSPNIHDVDRPTPQPGSWESVSLVGHPILISDLMVAEFRRPL